LVPSQPALPLPIVPTRREKQCRNRDSLPDLISHGNRKRCDGTALTTSKESSYSSPRASSREYGDTNVRKNVLSVGEETAKISSVPRISISLDTSPVFVESSVVYQHQDQNTKVSSETSRSHTSEASLQPISQITSTNDPSTTIRVVSNGSSASNSEHDHTQIRTVPGSQAQSPSQSLSPSARKPSTSSLVSQSSASSSICSQSDPSTTRPRQYSITRKSLPPSATTSREGSFDAARTGGVTTQDDKNSSNESAPPRRASYEPPRASRDEFGFGSVRTHANTHPQHAHQAQRTQHHNWHHRAENIHHRNHQQNQYRHQSHHPHPHPHYHQHHQHHQHRQQPSTDIGRGRSRLFVYQPRVEPPHINISAPSDLSTSPSTFLSLPQLPGLEGSPAPAPAPAPVQATHDTAATINKPVKIRRLGVDTSLLSPTHSQGLPRGSSTSSAGKENGKRDGEDDDEKESAAAAWQRRTRMFQMEDPNAHLRLRMVPG
jgi:hypothetical protein